jgi:hypothetical protein
VSVNLTGSHSGYISLLVALACGFYSIFLGQDKNWDLLNYHLYNPYAFLNDRIEFDLAPAGLQTWFNPLLDLIYYFAITHLGPKTVGFLLGFIQGLNFFLIYKIASKLLTEYKQKHLYALFLALAGVLTVGFQAEIGNSMQDSLVALFPLSSLWLILTAIGLLNEPNQRPLYGLITAAGIVAGIGVGLKLVSAIYALPLCLSLLILPVHWLQRFKLSLFFGISVLVGLFATGSYWMFETWRMFGNPLFPQFNNIFHGELATFDQIRDIRFLPKSFFEKVFYPILFTLNPQRVAELRYEQFSWLAAYIAVIGLLITKAVVFVTKASSKRPWNLEASYLLAFFCISFFLWLNIFGIYRYLVPLEILIPLILFVIITYIIRAHYSQWVALAFITLLTAINLPGAPEWGHADWAETVYRVEPSALTMGPEPAVVYLAGQPIAWIVAAMDIQTPFIQIVPNFPVSETYWQRAKMLAESRTGKSFVVFESDREQVTTRAAREMMKLGISIDENTCGQIVAYMGAGKFEYRYCETR